MEVVIMQHRGKNKCKCEEWKLQLLYSIGERTSTPKFIIGMPLLSSNREVNTRTSRGHFNYES